MQTLQQIITTLTALVMTLSAQVGDLTQSISPHTQLAQVAPTSGLVGHWKFDEGSGTNASDSAGSNTGTINGATWATGKVNGALSFDGSNNQVTTGNASLGSSSMSISTWIKPAVNTGGTIFYYSNSNNTNRLILSLLNGFVRIYEDSVGGQTGSVAIPTDAWTHITVTLDGSSRKVYVNGTINLTRATTYNPSANNGPYKIGTSGSSFFNGAIDEVRVYNRALSSSEVSDIYNDTGTVTSPPPPPPPPTPINGSCSTTLNSCSAGTFSDITDTSQSYLWQCNGSNGGTTASCSLPIPLAPDTTSPSIPSGLSATAVSASQINLSWTASTDPSISEQITSGMTGYDIYRNGSLLTSTSNNSYNNTGLSPSTLYSYTVRSKDAAGNTSSQSSSASATTQASTPPPSGNCSATNIRCVPSEYSTIQACASAAVAGDTCDVYAGSYGGWTQGVSGSPGNLITFRAHAGEVVTITSAITISSRSYVRITGFTFANGVGITANGTTNHNQIDHNTFSDARINNPDQIATASDNIISYNTWANTPNTTNQAGGITWRGNRNLIEHNDFSYGANDCMAIGGDNVVVRHNNCLYKNGRADYWGANIYHIDFVQVVGGVGPTLAFSLIENNVMKDCTNDSGNCHFAQVRASGGEIADTLIWRYNYEANLDGGYGGCGYHVDGTSTSPNCTHYNNTIATGRKVAANGQCVNLDAGIGYTRNNICYNTTAGSSSWSPIYYSPGGNGNGNITYTDGYSGS